MLFVMLAIAMVSVEQFRCLQFSISFTLTFDCWISLQDLWVVYYLTETLAIKLLGKHVFVQTFEQRNMLSL